MLFRDSDTGEAVLARQSGFARSAALGSSLIRFARRKPLGAIGAVSLAVPILVAILAPVIAPQDPYESFGKYVYAPPGSGGLLLGGDSLGRDVLSRLFYGARISLFVGVVSVTLGIGFGFIVGVISAYFGSWFDLLIQRMVDALISFPAIILALAIMAVLGAAVTNVIIALVVVLTPGAIRTVRSQALSVNEMDYILAARAVGCSHTRIIFHHLAPNCMAIFIILATVTLGFAIIVEASLSFLGVGVDPDIPTWGGMLNEAADVYVKAAPWLGVFPGLAIASVVMGANLLGDALRDVLDPRLRGT